jgi:hypothetical protein
MKNNQKTLLLLLPSWIVNFVGLTFGILATGATIVLSQYEGSELQRQIFEVQTNGTPGAEADSYRAIADNFANNNFLGALPLLLTWAAVGLIVYYFAIAIVRSFGQAAELRDELNYVHVSRQERLREAWQHLAIRIAAAVGWFVFIKITLSILIPYALSAAKIASQEFSLQAVGYTLLSVGVLYVTACIHAVFLRLIALKPRLFG